MSDRAVPGEVHSQGSRLTVVLTGLGMGAGAIGGTYLLRALGPAFAGLVLVLELLTVPAMLLVGFGIADTSSLAEF